MVSLVHRAEQYGVRGESRCMFLPLRSSSRASWLPDTSDCDQRHSWVIYDDKAEVRAISAVAYVDFQLTVGLLRRALCILFIAEMGFCGESGPRFHDRHSSLVRPAAPRLTATRLLHIHRSTFSY